MSPFLQQPARNRAEQKALLPTRLVLFLSSACSAIRTKELHAEKASRKNQNYKQKAKIQTNWISIKGFSTDSIERRTRNRRCHRRYSKKIAIAEKITVKEANFENKGTEEWNAKSRR